MNFKLKIFFITAFAACLLILSPARGIYAVDENVSAEKTQVLSWEEKKKEGAYGGTAAERVIE
jgi:hypothetical protein